jgi:UDP-N-acetylmuramate--alanine ligase
MHFHKVKRIHFVGIGGTGMCGMAEILHAMGFEVSGCDRAGSPAVDHLLALGIPVAVGHDPAHAKGAQVMVYSSAVPPDHPELAAAAAQNIPVIKRAEMLAQMVRLGFSIAVAGTHGKTTTTSLVGHLLTALGQDPTVIVGGRVKSFPGHARLGSGRHFVVEADEYDKSFLWLLPDLAVLTSVDADHLDTYGDFSNVCSAFLQFAHKVPFYGSIVLRLDDPHQRQMIPSLNRQIITYGFTPQADYFVHTLAPGARGMRFQLTVRDRNYPVAIPLFGEHNVANAAAALAVAAELDLPLEPAIKALESFPGVARRFDLVGEWGGAQVVDDYAHHPAEIEATLRAARFAFPGRRLVAVFQPHLYSRTRDFVQKFANALFNADVLVVTGIYAAREEPLPGVSGENIVTLARQMGHKQAYYLEGLADARAFLRDFAVPGAVILALGAGDITHFARSLAEGGRS